jgi:hypothetical protein
MPATYLRHRQVAVGSLGTSSTLSAAEWLRESRPRLGAVAVAVIAVSAVVMSGLSREDPIQWPGLWCLFCAFGACPLITPSVS